MLLAKGSVDVLVSMYQGIVDGVEVFFDEKEALDAFRDQAGMVWPEYLRQTKTKDAEAVLGDYAGTCLYSVDVRAKIGSDLMGQEGTMAKQKATAKVGYYKGGGMENYKVWERRHLEGADATFTDGQGNTIEVHVREEPYGYRIVVNGKEIATTFK